MKLRSLMENHSRTVHTITGDLSIGEAVSALRSHNVGLMVVVDPSNPNHIEGVLSERDVVRKLADLDWTKVREMKVKDLMTPRVITGGPDTSLREVMGLMLEKRFRHLPYFEDGTLISIISIGDVVRALMQEMEEEKEELNNYITGRYA